MDVLKHTFCLPEGNRHLLLSLSVLPNPGDGCSILISPCPPSCKAFKLIPSIACSSPPFRAPHGRSNELLVAGFVCSPKEKATFKVPTSSLLGRGAKPGSPDSLHSWSLTAWSPARLVFLLEALPQLRHSQGPCSVTSSSSYGVFLCLLSSSQCIRD